jgi:16S rRNA (cytidine1402-2'-O)-methyltransferase
MAGTLYLIPTPLGESPHERIFPEINAQIIRKLDCFIVENLRSARRFLRSAGYKKSFDEVQLFEIDKHAPHPEKKEYLKPLLDGQDTGLLSEAGAPGVADPGSEIIRLAHQHRIKVVPLIGPSSVLLALMASGLNGQQFAFSGYLPIKKPQRKKAIQLLEKRSKAENQSQIFIETPYRNISLLNDIIQTCMPGTLLCIAADITTNSEFIQTKTIKEWKRIIPEIHKRPAIFILLAQ